MSDRMKLLIDMDIGDDIDDAFALFMAMKMNYDIVGITTVFRNVDERSRITKKLLKLYGKGYENVPVYSGYGVVLDGEETEFPHLCQYSPDLDSDEYAPDCSDPDKAVDFIIDCCKKYGKDLTVIAIGPFTNIAKVIEKDKDILNTVGKFAIMGGAFYKQYADWNVMCDVKAADIMLKNIPAIECLGSDVTHQLRIGLENTEKLLAYSGSDPTAKYISDLYSYWRGNTKGIAMLHDPLVVYYVSHPEVCTMKDASVILFTEGFAKGVTFNVDSYKKAWMNKEAYEGFDLSKKIKVAAEVKKEMFIDLFMSLFEE